MASLPDLIHTTGAILRHGHLAKLSSSDATGLPFWKTRLVVLTPTTLLAFRSSSLSNSQPPNTPLSLNFLTSDQHTPVGTLELDATSQAYVCEHGVGVLEVRTVVSQVEAGSGEREGEEGEVTFRAWTLQCASQDDMMDWLGSLRQVIQQIKAGGVISATMVPPTSLLTPPTTPPSFPPGSYAGVDAIAIANARATSTSSSLPSPRNATANPAGVKRATSTRTGVSVASSTTPSINSSSSPTTATSLDPILALLDQLQLRHQQPNASPQQQQQDLASMMMLMHPSAYAHLAPPRSSSQSDSISDGLTSSRGGSMDTSSLTIQTYASSLVSSHSSSSLHQQLQQQMQLQQLQQQGSGSPPNPLNLSPTNSTVSTAVNSFISATGGPYPTPTSTSILNQSPTSTNLPVPLPQQQQPPFSHVSRTTSLQKPTPSYVQAGVPPPPPPTTTNASPTMQKLPTPSETQPSLPSKPFKPFTEATFEIKNNYRNTGKWDDSAFGADDGNGVVKTAKMNQTFKKMKKPPGLTELLDFV
ncbi:hypothetical protein HDU97_007645 [Phlyctochytrium planicorne]|nr:hypothetical protein HDU97_007645 [Phlyctochytrium planicorne]